MQEKIAAIERQIEWEAASLDRDTASLKSQIERLTEGSDLPPVTYGNYLAGRLESLLRDAHRLEARAGKIESQREILRFLRKGDD